MKKLLLLVLSIIMISSSVFAEDKKKEENYDYLFEVKQSKKAKTTKEYLADLSINKDEAAVVEAADYLGKEEEADAVKKLIVLLQQDKRIKVRLYSAIALGLIGKKTALDALGNAVLNDRSADVRYSSLLAIHRIGLDDKIGKDKAEDFIKKAKQSESDPYILDYIKKIEEMYKD